MQTDEERTFRSSRYVNLEYMLEVIKQSLRELLPFKNRTMKETDRIEYFLSHTIKEFSRKDYMNVFKDISSATASRDLKKAVELNLILKSGNDNKTIYKKV